MLMRWPWRRRRKLVIVPASERLFWSRIAGAWASAIGLMIGFALLASALMLGILLLAWRTK